MNVCEPLALHTGSPYWRCLCTYGSALRTWEWLQWRVYSCTLCKLRHSEIPVCATYLHNWKRKIQLLFNNCWNAHWLTGTRRFWRLDSSDKPRNLLYFRLYTYTYIYIYIYSLCSVKNNCRLSNERCTHEIEITVYDLFVEIMIERNIFTTTTEWTKFTYSLLMLPYFSRRLFLQCVTYSIFS